MEGGGATAGKEVRLRGLQTEDRGNSIFITIRLRLHQASVLNVEAQNTTKGCVLCGEEEDKEEGEEKASEGTEERDFKNKFVMV